jgi:hypothetical protein
MVNEADKLDLVDPGGRLGSRCCASCSTARPSLSLTPRSPAQQARDRLRDQAHLAAGLRPLRFTHGQVKFEPAYVQTVLAAVAS